MFFFLHFFLRKRLQVGDNSSILSTLLLPRLKRFIINDDEWSPLCLAFVGMNQNEKLTSLRLHQTEFAHPTESNTLKTHCYFRQGDFKPSDIQQRQSQQQNNVLNSFISRSSFRSGIYLLRRKKGWPDRCKNSFLPPVKSKAPGLL